MASVVVEKNHAIAQITLNRPDILNTFNQDMASELERATQDVAEDPNIRAVVLKGAGDHFMAGGDIGFFYQHLETMPAGVSDIINQLAASVRHLQQMPKPVLACVQGSVAGAGVSLMLACDLVLAAEQTVFTLAYTGIGTSPDGGASYFLPRLVGQKKALELMLLSDRFDAKQAQAWGLINWQVPAAEIATTAQSIVTRLAQGPTKAYAECKKLSQASWDNTLEQQFDAENVAFTAMTTTEDFKSGVTAFIKKQKPEFVGE